MLRSRERGQRKERGFTLIELMLVIVILGILAGVAVTNLTNVSQEAKVTRAKTDVQTIVTAVKMYEISMGSYPSDDQGIEELCTKTDEHKAFLDKVPKDPWGETYSYREESDNGLDFPDIWSNGPDKEEGTDDDIGNWEKEETGGGEGGGSSEGSSGGGSQGGGGTAE